MTLTKHALIRAQQRGIQIESIETAMKMGRRIHLPGNAVGYEITRRQANLLIQQLDLMKHRLEKAQNVRVVASGDDPEVIITVCHRH